MQLLILAAAFAAHTEFVTAPYDFSSRYLTMRDGVRIAIDVYVPRGLASGARVPAVLHQTRYFRSHRVVFPANLFWGGLLEPTIKRYAARGYAYVVVDARGSGASFGTRPQEWSPDEIRDGAEVADWIVAQPWSNGRIGTTGVSYDGTAAEFSLSNVHPAIRAAVPRSALFDAYSDVAFPGGVKQAPFIEFWSRMTSAQDSNRFNSMLTGIAKLAYRGVKPVQGDSGEHLLQAASREHERNYNMAAAIGKFEFSDETGEVQAMSPYTRRAEIERSGAAIYSVSGWYDAALMNAAIKCFLTIRTPGSRLILGPWSHQGENLSPFAAKLKDFDHVDETIRFFDRHLKSDSARVTDEAPVRYYTVGEEKWKTAETWPPPGAARQTLFLGLGGHLTDAPPRTTGEPDRYQVDSSIGSGQETRWNNQTALDVVHQLERDRSARDRKLLVYQGEPLATDMEVTGHPTVSFYVSSTERDGALFVYLEDLAPDGRVSYVTEGVLRLIHRNSQEAGAPYRFPAPYRSFAKGDVVPLEPGEIVKFNFDLFPISYLFRAGHSIRIAISGSDADHFAQIPDRPPLLSFYRDRDHPSAITLPVMVR